MSGFAMFSLKDPSFLAFDERRNDETKLNNLKHIYSDPKSVVSHSLDKKCTSAKTDCEDGHHVK